MSGTDLAYAATGTVYPYPPDVPRVVSPPIVLRIRYAMSGTDIAHASMVLRSSYAMSGTDVVYAAIVLCGAGY
eukprot:1309470-Rhodomonas_salina.2